jgi:hypothetical protein
MDLSWNTIKIPGMIKVDESMDENEELLHASRQHPHDNCCWRLEYSPWWLKSSDMPGNCLYWVALASSNLSLPAGLKIWPLLNCMNPG